MTSNRPYGRAIDVPEALSELRRNAGSQFDPEVIEIFCSELAAGRLGVEGEPLPSGQVGEGLPV
jgi:HD-GYP domain-containing protein (c-di-GMP phosphodiesterase class II)